MVQWINPARPEMICAVEGCAEQGHVQICPFDGRYHHHGHIHYTNDYGWPELFGFRFIERDGIWHYVCNTHIALIKEAVDRRVELSAAARKAIDTLNDYLS